jgi:hypothetical protein
MMRSAVLCAALLLMAGAARGETITCKGNITSTQAMGLAARKYRFEVSDVTAQDIMAVLEKCKKIAQDMQNHAARKNPGGAFSRFSDVELQCVQGTQTFQIKRALQTGR